MEGHPEKPWKYFGFKLRPEEKADEYFGLDMPILHRCGCGDSSSPKSRHRSWMKASWHLVQFSSAAFALVYTAWSSSEKPKYLIFLTNWALVLSAVTYTLQLGVSMYKIRTTTSEEELSPFEKALIFLLNAISSVTTVITIMYWSMLYPSLLPSAKFVNLDKILGHGLVPAIVFVDLLFFSTRPVRWQHFFHPLSVGLSWVVFSAIYCAAGGTGYKRHSPDGVGRPYIYKQVDWTNSPGWTLLYVGMIAVCIVAVHLAVWGISWGRDCLCRSRPPPSLRRRGGSGDIPGDFGMDGVSEPCLNGIQIDGKDKNDGSYEMIETKAPALA